MKKIKNAIACILLAVVIALHISTRALAGTPYLASDLLGQSTGGVPDFSTFDANDEDDSIPNAIGFNSVNDVAIDTNNHFLFVGDWFNSRVLVHTLDTSNHLIDRTADYVLGQNSFSTDTGGLSQSKFNGVSSLDVDVANMRLFVSDLNNHRVLVFDYSSITNGENAINVLGQSNYTSSGSGLSQSKFYQPSGVAFDDATERLFVADRMNKRVMVFDVSTIVNGESAINVLGKPDFTTNTSTGVSQTNTNFLGSLAVDSDNQKLFVNDSSYSRTLIFDINTITDGEAAVNVIGASDFDTNGSNSADAVNATGSLEFDPDNSLLYVGSSSLRRVSVFDVSTISNGESAVSVLGASSLTANGNFSVSQSSIVGSSINLGYGDGRLYVSQSTANRVTIFDVSSINNGEDAVDILGQENSDGSGSFTTAGQNNVNPGPIGLDNPASTAVDEQNHRLFIADASNNRVLVHQLDSKNHIVDLEAEYVLGQPNFTSSVPDRNQSGFDFYSTHSPDIIFDSTREWLFVSDTDNNRILVFDVATIVNNEPAIHVLGRTDFTSSGDSWPTFNQNHLTPTGLAYDQSRQLLFAVDRRRIIVFDVKNISNGENAINVLGQPDFTTSTFGSTAANGFWNARDIDFDPVNKWLFVSDSTNDRVMIWDTKTISNHMDASYVLGSNSLSSAGAGGLSQTTIENPVGITFDYENRYLYVKADSHNRVLVFDLNSVTNGEPAVGVLGATSYSGACCSISPNTAYVGNWSRLTYNHSGNSLFAASRSANKTTEFRFVRFSDSSLSSATLNESYSHSFGTTNHQGTLTFTKTSGTMPPGITLSSAGVLSGTPAQAGSYTFQVTVSDDNGVAGTFTDKKSFTLGVSTTNQFSEDKNGDGIQDSVQSNVMPITSDVTGENVVLEADNGCDISSTDMTAESENSTQDAGFDYPLGIMDFTMDCGTNGYTTTITQYYFNANVSDYVARKYNPSTNAYFNIDGASVTQTTVYGSPAVKVTYQITDGGDLDIDGTANGTIVDPVGLAESAIDAPNTGLGGTQYN